MFRFHYEPRRLTKLVSNWRLLLICTILGSTLSCLLLVQTRITCLSKERAPAVHVESISRPTAPVMPTYTVFPIESPFSPFYLEACKRLRLASLQTDPQAFGSNYAREIAFSEDVWRERLDGPFKRVIIASASDASKLEDAIEDEERTGKWIGMACIVGPSSIPPSILTSFKEAGVGDKWEFYAMFGMWVYPAHRGKGIGVQLVEACQKWARAHIDPMSSGKRNGDFEKVAILLVKDDNVAGRALYTRMGFTDVKGVCSDRGGETWMSVKL